MSVGETITVICDAAIPRADQRAAVLERIRSTGHKVIRIDFPQLEAFAGNMLELRSSAGERVLAMSRQAYDSLRDEQLEVLRQNGRIAAAAIDDIESSAGGSVRCMLAEIHLPRR